MPAMVLCSPATTKSTWAFRGAEIFPRKKLAIPRAQKFISGKKSGAPLPNFPVWVRLPPVFSCFKCYNYLKEGLCKRMRLIKGKDLPDFETGHSENLRSAVSVRWVMKVSISLSFCLTLLVIIQKNQNVVIFFTIY